MKSFALIFFISVVIYSAKALTEEQKEKIKNHHIECAKTSHVNQALLEKLRQGEFTDDKDLKAHLFCFFKRANFMTPEGEIQKDVIKAKLLQENKDEAAVDKLITLCGVKKDTPEETAFSMFKCYYVSTPNHVALA